MNIKTKSRAKRVCFILLTVVLSYIALSMAGSVVIFQIIFARNAVVNDFELSYSDIDSEKYPRSEFYFDSEGTKLFSCIYMPEEKPSGLILISNGMNSCIDRHLPEAIYFIDRGWSVMTYENTGVGNSGGASAVGLAQARIDAVSAIEYIRSNDKLKNLPLMLYGHSLGGYAVTTALSDEENIGAVVSISAFNSPNENMLYTAEQRVGVLADIQYPFMCLQNYFLFGEKSDDTAVDAINSTDTPVMIVSGNSDDIVPYDISIAKNADEITNPNAVFLSVEEEYRGEHSTPWLDKNAAKYVTEEENPTDKQAANKLDEDFMNTVLEFFNSSLNDTPT